MTRPLTNSSQQKEITPQSVFPQDLQSLYAVTLTALAAQYQCSMCREFDPEFAIVAQSWKRAHPQSDGVFFAKLDFGEGRSVFTRVTTPNSRLC